MTKPVSLAMSSYKGGVGKTSLSLHLSSSMKLRGYNVALIDLDPQGSATAMRDAIKNSDYSFDIMPDTYDMLHMSLDDWKAQEEAIASMGFDVLIYDYPPGVAGVELQGRHDVVIVPLKACWPDFEAAQRGIQSLSGDKVLPVMNMVDRKSPYDEQFVDAMREDFENVVVIPSWSIFKVGNNHGQTVYTLPKNMRKRTEAIALINNLTQQAIDLLDVKK